MLQFVEKITAKWRKKLPMFIWQSGKVLLSMLMHILTFVQSVFPQP